MLANDPEVKLLAKLDLGRPMLNHDDERERPACAGHLFPFSIEPNFARNADPGIRHETFEQLRRVARMFCVDCPVFDECARYADERREEGLWAGVYRIRTDGKHPARGYRRYPLLADSCAVA